MLNSQSYLATSEEEMLFDDTTPITFGENKKSNCKANKTDLPVPYPTGKTNRSFFFPSIDQIIDEHFR